MRAWVIAIGSELLGEDRVDTNSLRLAEVLARHGVALAGKSVVGDLFEDLVSEIEHAMARAEVIVTSGGLGPTSDDMTRQAVASVLDLPLREDPALVADIREKFRRFRMPMPEVNRRQAMVPEGARVLANSLGTAPGLEIAQGNRTLFLLPGVPKELIGLVETYLEPWLSQRSGEARLRSESLRVACRSESSVEEALTELYEEFDASEITVLASVGDLEVRCSVRDDGPAARQRLERMTRRAEELLGDSVYAHQRATDLETVVGDELTRRQRTVATAESCTGGLIAERLTRVPGSSAYFRGGVVTYADPTKVDLLGVDRELLASVGAVSEEVARAMAHGVRELLDTDYGIGVTGIAGPSGGSADKPVGTVHVALARRDGTGDEKDHRLLTIPGDRERVRRLTSQWALELLRRRLRAS